MRKINLFHQENRQQRLVKVNGQVSINFYRQFHQMLFILYIQTKNAVL